MDWDDQSKDTSLNFFINGIKALWELIGLGKAKKNFILVIIWIIILSIINLLFPYLLKLVFDELPIMIKTQTINNYFIILMILMFITKVVANYINRFIKEVKLCSVIIDLENFWPIIAQEKLLALSLGYHERENTGQKIAKIEKGCNKMIEIMMNLFWHFLPQISYLIINIIFVLIIDLKLGLLFFLPFIPAIWLNLKCYNKFFDDWVKWDKHKEVSSGLICQSLMNVDTVQGFVQEEKEKNVFSGIRYAMRDLDKQISIKMQSYFFWMEMILHCCFILTIIAGIYFVYQGQSSIGTVIYIIATGNTSFNSIWELTHAYTQIMKNLVPVLRMRDLMNEKIEIKNSASAVIPDNFKGQFEFRNVCFGYSKKREKVFEDFNLTILPNQMVALVGPSGEGKTTVARLICRTYEVNSGKILLDGYDIKDLDLFWYRRLFAIVHQDVQLFDTTIANNIRYGCKEASDEDVLKAIKASHLEITLDNHDRFPDGIQTEVGERGIRLSGGEKQRVGIARAYIALLYGAKVLILDEATSSLDSEAEKAIQNMLDELRQNASIAIIAIAHRLSTIKKADVICVISDGQIIERGNHARLMQRNGLYSRLAELQNLGDLRE